MSWEGCEEPENTAADIHPCGHGRRWRWCPGAPHLRSEGQTVTLRAAGDRQRTDTKAENRKPVGPQIDIPEGGSESINMKER